MAKVMERVAYAMHKFAGEDPDFLPPDQRAWGVKEEDLEMAITRPSPAELS